MKLLCLLLFAASCYAGTLKNNLLPSRNWDAEWEQNLKNFVESGNGAEKDESLEKKDSDASPNKDLSADGLPLTRNNWSQKDWQKDGLQKQDSSLMKSNWQWAAPLAEEWSKLDSDQKAQLLNNWPLVWQWIAKENKWSNEWSARKDSKNSQNWWKKDGSLKKDWSSRSLPKNWPKDLDNEGWSQSDSGLLWAAPLAQEWLKLDSDQKTLLLNNWPSVWQWIAQEKNWSNEWSQKKKLPNSWNPNKDWQNGSPLNKKDWTETGNGWMQDGAFKKDLPLNQDWLSRSLPNNWPNKDNEEWNQNNWQWTAPLAKEWLKLDSEQKALLLNNWPSVLQWITGLENGKPSNNWSQKQEWSNNWQQMW